MAAAFKGHGVLPLGDVPPPTAQPERLERRVTAAKLAELSAHVAFCGAGALELPARRSTSAAKAEELYDTAVFAVAYLPVAQSSQRGGVEEVDAVRNSSSVFAEAEGVPSPPPPPGPSAAVRALDESAETESCSRRAHVPPPAPVVEAPRLRRRSGPDSSVVLG